MTELNDPRRAVQGIALGLLISVCMWVFILGALFLVFG